MRDLKVHVERIVRPIRASGRRKDRMREELLAHLTATYQEEVKRDGDESAALARALERFGDPDELRRELQASVPLADRILFAEFLGHSRYVAFVRRLGKQPAESALRFAARVTLAVAVLWGSVDALFIALIVTGHLWQGKPVWPSLNWVLRLFGAFHGPMLLYFFLCALCVDRLRRAIKTRPLPLRNAFMSVAWCALAVPITAGTGALISILAPSFPPDRFGHVPDVDVARIFLPVFWAFIAATPLFIVWVGVAGLADQKRYHEWESLKLDE
jgi:hypothetical protein